MSFICERAGCEDEPVGSTGKCVAHLREDLLARRAEKQEETEMAKGTKAVEGSGVRTCPCGAELTPKARRGLCRDCIKKEAQRKYHEKRKAADGAAPQAPKPINVTINAGDIDPEMVAADMIHHPRHYTRGKIEVIDFIEDQGLGYHDGNVVKYICRHRHKGSPLDDLRKARWYLDRLIEREEAEHGA